MSTPSRILVVEDEAKTAQTLELYLSSAGYRVDTAGDGQAALRMCRDQRFDLVILDVMLPRLDGLTVCRRLRAESDVWILLLTARGETEHRIAGLEAGADDYLAKPFEPKELLLRINAILRRMPETPAQDAVSKILHLGPIRYDIERGEMWQGEDPVRLTATESQLMKIFSGQPGEPISRAKLVEDLGRDKGQAQERAVDVQITRLRRKIEQDPKQPRYLQTVRGAGYMLAPD